MSVDDLVRISEALSYAAEAHRYQIYEGLRPNTEDEPYIYHPIRVSQQVEGESRKIVALLHDLLEDTDYMLPEFLTIAEANAIKLLTNNTKDYKTYILEICNATRKSASIARDVKIADIMDNLQHAPEDFSKKSEYQWALEQLIKARVYDHERNQ